jgi:uncharacterized protein DUF5677
MAPVTAPGSAPSSCVAVEASWKRATGERRRDVLADRRLGPVAGAFRDLEVEKLIADRFATELAVCRELMEFADNHLVPWSGRKPEGEHELLIAAEAARATKSYRASVHLAASGYGEQAAMVNRSAFEGMTVAHWISTAPEEAVGRYKKHTRHNSLLWAKALTQIEWLEANDDLPEASDEEWKELTDLFGPYGTRLWTGHRNLPALVDDIEDLWTASPQELREFHAVAHRDANLLLHSGSSALNRIGRRLEEVISFDIGPSDQYIPQALLAAFWIYVQTFSLLMNTFEMPDREHLNTLFARGAEIFGEGSRQRRSEAQNPCVPGGQG